MDVDRDAKLFCHFPELVVLGLVVEEVRLSIWPGMLDVVDEGAMESELVDAACQLFSCLTRVVPA